MICSLYKNNYKKINVIGYIFFNYITYYYILKSPVTINIYKSMIL